MSEVPERTYPRALTAIVGFDRRARPGRIGLPTLFNRALVSFLTRHFGG